MAEDGTSEIVELPAWKRRQESLRSADSDHLGYDFHKTIMNVSLLALGATLTLGETAFADRIPDAGLYVATGLIALGGVLSFLTLQEMVRIFNGSIEYSQPLRFFEPVGPTLFAGGVGAFVGLALGLFG